MVMLNGINLAEIQCKELADTIERLNRITDGSYDLYDKNDAAIVRLLDKILKLAKQEKEWYIYFYALHMMIYQRNRSGNNRAIVKYAEIFYKDQAMYMEEALAKYPNTDLSYFNTWILDSIFNAYWYYHQMDDVKMKAFMKRFEESAIKYGKTFTYYKAEMYLAVLYRDVELAKHGKKYFDKYEKEVKSCYICAHKQHLGYYLLLDNLNKAEELLNDYINHNIPSRHLWCYKYCQAAENLALYLSVLEDCILLGKMDYFNYFCENYWKKQPRENWRADAGRTHRSLSMLLCALNNNFDELDEDLREAEMRIKEAEKKSTVDNMLYMLEWWRYFDLLDKSGVHAVAMDLPELKEDENGMLSVRELSQYMEQRADDYGMKFAKARKQFDYQLVKSMFLKMV